MKNIIVTLILLAGWRCLAQDPQLFLNTWYLQKVIIDQVEYDFPFGGGTAEINFTEITFNLSHPICEEGFPTNIEYIGSDSFTNTDGGNSLVGTCDFPIAVYFQRHYQIFLHDDHYTAKNPFSYLVTTSGNQSALVVTNVNGDQAIYGDQQLSNESFVKIEFAIYPNPAGDALNFSGLEQGENGDLKLYDTFGKIISTQAIDLNTKEIDVSKLSSGIYFLQLRLKNGGVFNKKLVKI